MKEDSTLTNLAQVLDKIVDKTGEGVMFMVEKIQEIAPYAWEIALRQVYAEAIGYALIPSLFLVVAIVILRWSLKKYERSDRDYTSDADDVRIGISIGAGIVSLGFAIPYIAKLVMVLINPNYYAILKIVEMAGLK